MNLNRILTQTFIAVLIAVSGSSANTMSPFTTRSLKLLIAVFATILLWPLTTLAGPIEDLQPGQWYEIQNSKLRAVLPSPSPAGDPAAIMTAWSGGAYDSDRDRLIVWGGGHNDYAGNEIYAFDVKTLAWNRLTNPGSDPVSVHTYDQLEYIPTNGGGVENFSPQVVQSTRAAPRHPPHGISIL